MNAEDNPPNGPLTPELALFIRDEITKSGKAMLKSERFKEQVRKIVRQQAESDDELSDLIGLEASAHAMRAVRREGAEMRGLAIEALQGTISAQMERLRDEFVPRPTVVEVHRSKTGRAKRFKALHHRQLPDLIRMAAARTHAGFPIPIYLFGPPAGGKSTLAKHTAQALEIPYYPVALGSTTTETKVIGYTNLANGQFVAGALYEPFKNGGLAFLDEIDVADPGVLVGTNALISEDSYRFPHGEVVQRHRDFYLLAGGNTAGTGPMGGFMRNKLDAAFIDRWIKVEVAYDPDLEASVSGNERWTDYVQRVRHHVETTSFKNVYITPRATSHGAALLAAGVPVEKVIEVTILNGLSEELKRSIQQNVKFLHQ
jgi:hypothetical protein